MPSRLQRPIERPLTERQQALVNYCLTIAKDIRGFRSVDDLAVRVFAAVQQDVTSIADVLGRVLVQRTVRIATERVQAHAAGILGGLADEVQNFLESFGRRR